MKDARKFRILAASAVLLCVITIAYGVATEYLVPDIEGYIKRRLYYENVISKKGLSLHKALYWRKVQE